MFKIEREKMNKTIKKWVSLFMVLALLVANISIIKGGSTTKVYFLNSNHWSKVYAYAYANNADVDKAWPGYEAVKESGDWYSVTINRSASDKFNIIFHESDADNNRIDVGISDDTNVYLDVKGGKHASKAETLSAMGLSSPYTKLSKTADLTGIGADMPYTEYEAEDAKTNATVLTESREYLKDIQSEARGREAVKLVNNSDYVEFKVTKTCNALVLRYCLPDSADGVGIDATLGLYGNNNKIKNVDLTSRYSWVYGAYPFDNNVSGGGAHRYFDEKRVKLDKTYNPGDTIKFQKDSGNNASYYIIDFIETEMVGSKLSKPSGALSITDYGAVSNDNKSDYKAITDCINAAKNQGKIVWIPEGNFELPENKTIEARNVTIKGAGIWYANLNGLGAAFTIYGKSEFYNFAMNGGSVKRLDNDEPSAFAPSYSMKNSGIVLDNIWIEHVKVGMWSDNTENLVIRNCRIRNTFADGINLCSNTTGAKIYNNSLRGTGDDCMAIWPWMGDSTGNEIYNNTIELPMLANCMALYGGKNNKFHNNLCRDTINNGSGMCISTEFDTSNGFNNTNYVYNNVLMRCGTKHYDYNYPVGAIWIWNTKQSMSAECIVENNRIYDSRYEGILLDCWKDISNMTFRENKIYGATDGMMLRGNANGNVIADNVGVANFTGSLIKSESNSVNVSKLNKGVYKMDDISEEIPTTQQPTTQQPTTQRVTQQITTQQPTTQRVTQQVTTQQTTQPINNSVLKIKGYQISTTLGGIRAIGNFSEKINNKTVKTKGFIYGLKNVDGNNLGINDNDIVLNSNNSYVKCYESTGAGLLEKKDGVSTYVRTMLFSSFSKKEFSAEYGIRAYAVLEDGSVSYSDVYNFSIVDVAKTLYTTSAMNNEGRHDYLYNNIIKVVEPNYAKVKFDYNKTLVN